MLTGALASPASDPLSVLAASREPGVGGRAALVTAADALTYSDLAGRVSAAVARLAELGIERGARVAIRANASVETCIALLAVTEMGAALLPLHPRLNPGEIAALLSGVAATSLPDERVAELTARAAEVVVPGRIIAGRIDPREELSVVPTSGTSGRPKLAALTRAAFLASAEASADNLGWRDDDRWLCCMPLAHVGGLSILIRCLVARRTMILVPRFDPEQVLSAIGTRGATLLSVVPTQLRDLLDADGRAALEGLRAILVGGAACPLAWLEECAARGITALTTYGLTEACSQVTTQRLAAAGQPPRAALGCGEPLAGVGLRIAGPGGAPLPPGDLGRIQVRGPTLMRGYLGEPPLAEWEWFDTGDIGWQDPAGALFVEARRTDLIVTGGENVYPAEVEREVLGCRGVRAALVFGVPDERWGQTVAVLLEVDPERFDRERLAAELTGRLASHKLPRRFAVVEALPRTAAGKPDRRAAQSFEASLHPLRV